MFWRKTKLMRTFILNRGWCVDEGDFTVYDECVRKSEKTGQPIEEPWVNPQYRLLDKTIPGLAQKLAHEMVIRDDLIKETERITTSPAPYVLPSYAEPSWTDRPGKKFGIYPVTFDQLHEFKEHYSATYKKEFEKQKQEREALLRDLVRLRRAEKLFRGDRK